METNISASPANPPDSPASSEDSITTKPDITLYFLQSSRAIRIAWLLEELGLEYKVVYFDREAGGAAPREFAAGKSF